MITSLQPFFPLPQPPTLLPKVLEQHRERLPTGTNFAYLHVTRYHDFCLEPGAVVASDRDAVRAIVARSTAVLFDIGVEGPAFHPQFATQLARFANLYGVEPRRMIVLNTNEVFEAALRGNVATPRIAADVQWVWFHHHLVLLAMRARRQQHFRLGHDFVAGAARPVPFLSLNATPKGHRAMLAYLIATHPQREKFVCSFTIDGPKAFPRHTQNVLRPIAARFGVTWDEMQPVLADAARFDRTLLADHHPGSLVNELEPELYARTRASLVTETEMTAGETVRTTEKAFKPLLLGQPLVAFGNPGTLRLLRDLGADTFDDVLDNGYDALTHPADRFAAAWRLVETLLADDAGFTREPAVAERLHANVALFEGSLLQRATERTMRGLRAALP